MILDPEINHWQTYAACGGAEPSLWDTPSGPPSVLATAIPLARAAIAICKTCPVRGQCGAEARQEKPKNVIRAGIPYNDKGNAMLTCNVCYEHVLNGDPRTRYCEDHKAYDLVRLGRRAR